MASALTNFISVKIDAAGKLTVTGRNNDPSGSRVPPAAGTVFKLAVISVSDATKRCEPEVKPKDSVSSPWTGTSSSGHGFSDGEHVYVVGLAKLPPGAATLPTNESDFLWAQEVCINEPLTGV